MVIPFTDLKLRRKAQIIRKGTVQRHMQLGWYHKAKNAIGQTRILWDCWEISFVDEMISVLDISNNAYW
jgi:hypothetical protein